jgi:hypothetical protein
MQFDAKLAGTFFLKTNIEGPQTANSALPPHGIFADQFKIYLLINSKSNYLHLVVVFLLSV